MELGMRVAPQSLWPLGPHREGLWVTPLEVTPTHGQVAKEDADIISGEALA